MTEQIEGWAVEKKVLQSKIARQNKLLDEWTTSKWRDFVKEDPSDLMGRTLKEMEGV